MPYQPAMRGQPPSHVKAEESQVLYFWFGGPCNTIHSSMNAFIMAELILWFVIQDSMSPGYSNGWPSFLHTAA